MKTIKHTFSYSHSPEAIWDYLTKPELIAQWLMSTDFKPEIGHEFNFITRPMPQFGFNGIIYCKVLELVPNKKLVYSWKGGPGDGEAFTLDSVVTWVLNPTAKGCDLQLEHSGFKNEQLTAFTMMDKGWGSNIAKIEEFLTQKEVRRSWYFNQPPQIVWDYLTKPELIEQWLMTCDFKPVAGYKFRFINKEKIDAFCQVLEIVPHKFLSYKWQKGKSENELTVDSVVKWTLSEDDGGTKLLLQHTGFLTMKDITGHSWGWDYCVNRMTERLNSIAHASSKV